MPRPRRDYLRHADWRLQELAEWEDRHIESSAIGYPKQTAESMAGQGRGPGKPTSICPEVMMPDRISIVAHAVRDMPFHMQRIYEAKYKQAQKVSRKKLDDVLHWVAARIAT